MIIAALIASALLLFISMVAIKQRGRRLLAGLVFGILIILTTGLIIKNDRDHFGMQQVSQTRTYRLNSSVASRQASLLLYQPIGANQEKVYLYKTARKSKMQQTNPDPSKAQVTVKHTAGRTTLKVKTIRWRYRNQNYRTWFGIAGNDGQLIKKVYTFNVGKNWLVLSTKQAKQLKKELKQKQAQIKQAAVQYVAQQVKAGLAAALQKDPTMTAAQRQQLSQKIAKRAAAEYQKQAIEQLVKQFK